MSIYAPEKARADVTEDGSLAIGTLPIYPFGHDVRPPGEPIVNYNTSHGQLRVTYSEQDRAIFVRWAHEDGGTVSLNLEELACVMGSAAAKLRAAQDEEEA